MNLFQVTKKQPSGLELKTFTGNPVTFTPSYSEALPEPFNGISLKANILASGGNGTPSTPIPIVGHSELNLVRCGKNLITPTYYSGETYTTNGVTFTNNNGAVKVSCTNATGNAYYIMFANIDGERLPIKAGTYTISCPEVTADCRINFNVIDVRQDVLNNSQKSYTFTAPTDTEMFINILVSSGATNIDLTLHCQIEVGSQPTPYAPYNGTPYLVSFGQTVYGGEYDANRGKVSDSGYLKDTFTFGETALIAINQYGIANFGIVISTPFDFSKGAIANCLERQYTSGADTQTEGFFINASNELYVRLESTRASTVNEFLAWANANLEILFMRTTPIEIDVSELSVDTIVGVNNIISDGGGDIEVQCLI